MKTKALKTKYIRSLCIFPYTGPLFFICLGFLVCLIPCINSHLCAVVNLTKWIVLARSPTVFRHLSDKLNFSEQGMSDFSYK